MAQAVARCLARGDVGLFEAGTGTGKSLAYLIPAAQFALERGRPVVIATYTISLQQQLLEKEIPIVQRIFPELKAVLVKGWRNYICHLRLEAMKNTTGDLWRPDANRQFLQLLHWAQTTQDGTLADLDFEPDPELWDEVCAESDSCLRAQCPYYQRCPFFRDRAELERAQLLIVNHHLLFADVGIRGRLGWQSEQGVLPAYSSVIIDESHHVEEVATQHLGTSVSSVGAAQLFGRIHRRQRGKGTGFLPQLRAYFTMMEAEEFVAKIDGEVMPALDSCQRFVEAVFDAARAWRADGDPGREEAAQFRIPPADADRWDQEVGGHAAEASAALSDLATLLGSLGRGLPTAQDGPAETPSETPIDGLTLRSGLDAFRRRVQQLAQNLEAFATLNPQERVYWIERHRRRRERVRLVSAPIDVGAGFIEWVSEACEGIVLLSATLAVSGSFAYVKERLGIGSEREIAGRLDVQEGIFPSPFEYESQALLGVVDDLPEPTDRAFAERLPSALLRIIQASEGRALVLFTSHQLLQSIKATLQGALAEAGIPLLAQGDAPRYQLLEAFRKDQRSVLFGTDTFWEGIDVPGEALVAVVVTRLPFDVPTEPVAEARAERLRAHGLSPFVHYALPRAALKLKQGFGRLIRTGADRGAVIICDRRVVGRPYGREFLDALPPARRLIGGSDEIAAAVTRFLAEGR